jgi:hypothetical protein
MSKRFFPFTVVGSESESAPRLAAGAGDVPIEQQLADAFNANNAVLAYATGIAKTTLPALSTEPDWYKTFKKRFADAKIHAMKWSNTIVPNLVSIPAGIANYAFTWNTTMMSVDAALTVLVKDPKNAEAQQAVLNGLNQLVGGLSTFENLVGSFGEEIKTFAADISADAQILQKASASAKQTAGYNRQQVEELTKTIKALQDEVKTWQAVQTAAGIAAGVIFFIGACIAIFSFGLGLAIGIIGAAAGIATAIAAGAKINTLSAEIRAQQGRMDDLNQQIATLDTLVNTLLDLVKLAQAAGDQMKLVIAAWDQLGKELRTVITDLKSASGDVSKLDIAGLQRDLAAANADWTKLREFCLKIAAVKYMDAAPPTVVLPTSKSAAAA